MPQSSLAGAEIVLGIFFAQNLHPCLSSALPVTLRAMWTAKATISPIRTRLVAQRAELSKMQEARERFEYGASVIDNLGLALRDIDLLLDCIEDFCRKQSTTLSLLRLLSDNPPTENSRRTGRTARLLLRALIAISAGKDVAVIAASQQQALQMKVDIERHCRSWNIPYDGGPWRPHGDDEATGDDRDPLVRACTPDAILEGFRGVTLVDHFVIEKMEAVSGCAASEES